jgi:cytochrome b
MEMALHTEPLTESTEAERRVRVWDAFVRIFHWSVAIAFFVAYFSEDDLLTVHVWAGYTIGALVMLRIAWGFVGPRHARFSDFVTGPWRALRYLLNLVAGRAKRHLGHSPAGGVMVLLLLVGLLGTVWSGMELHAIENNAGPLAAVVATSPGTTSASSNSLAILSVARADEDNHEQRDERVGHCRFAGEEFWEEIHESLANGIMALVVLHVLGVMLASVAHRENLVGSMFTGTKRAE